MTTLCAAVCCGYVWLHPQRLLCQRDCNAAFDDGRCGPACTAAAFLPQVFSDIIDSRVPPLKSHAEFVDFSNLRSEAFEEKARATPHHTTPHHATRRHTTPHHATPRTTHNATPHATRHMHHTTLHNTTPHHTPSHHAAPHNTTPHHTTLCHATPHHIMPSHATHATRLPTPPRSALRQVTPHHTSIAHHNTTLVHSIPHTVPV